MNSEESVDNSVWVDTSYVVGLFVHEDTHVATLAGNSVSSCYLISSFNSNITYQDQYNAMFNWWTVAQAQRKQWRVNLPT